MLTKLCPKCNQPHQKLGIYCSRPCANSRGPRSEEFKSKVSKKLKKDKMVGPFCRIQYSDITGRIISSDNSNRSFWDTKGKGSFLKKVCKWFNIIPGVYPDTEVQLQALADQLYELYNIKGYSCSEIKDYLNIPLSDGHTPAFLKQMGITRRNNSDSRKAYIFKNGINQSKSNRYKTG